MKTLQTSAQLRAAGFVPAKSFAAIGARKLDRPVVDKTTGARGGLWLRFGATAAQERRSVRERHRLDAGTESRMA